MQMYLTKIGGVAISFEKQIALKILHLYNFNNKIKLNM
jgi:hypothetical protein